MMRGVGFALLTSVAIAAVDCRRVESEPSVASARVESAVAPSASARASSARAAATSSAPAPVAAATAAPEPSGLPPLESEARLSLQTPGFQPAVVHAPVGVRSARPVVVALHGNFDRPEWQCQVWGELFESRAFVLCPRGLARRDVPPSEDRWEYGSQRAVLAELDAGVAALQQRFGDYVERGPLILIGFSLGAIFGSPIALADPARFSRVVVIEGGLGSWSPAQAKRFRERGGKRLIIACGQPGCLGNARQLQPRLEKVGLPTRVGGSNRAGHTYDGVVADVVREHLDWLLADDPETPELPSKP